MEQLSLKPRNIDIFGQHALPGFPNPYQSVIAQWLIDFCRLGNDWAAFPLILFLSHLDEKEIITRSLQWKHAIAGIQGLELTGCLRLDPNPENEKHADALQKVYALNPPLSLQQLMADIQVTEKFVQLAAISRND